MQWDRMRPNDSAEDKMAFSRARSLQHLLKQLKPVTQIQLAACHNEARPFLGAIEQVSTTWKAHGELKHHQDSLPCQPVPPLTQTMERFLASVRPLLNDDKYSRAVKLTREFAKPGGEGEKLQNLLQQRADTRENWLADWWIKVAYLGYRDPVTVYVNPFYVGPPMEQYRGQKGRIRCAAVAIASVIDWKEKTDCQSLPIETLGQTPQCMIQYYHILGCSRVPAEGVDTVVCHHRHDPSAPKHVTIICNNNIFRVDVYDDNWEPLNVDQIEAQLEQVERQSQTRAPPVGALTSAQRDNWFQSYTELRKDEKNAAHLDSIHQSLFVVSMDQSIPGYSPERHFEVMSHAQLGGAGVHLNTGNRWCDKQLQLTVNHDGVFGFLYEHSVAEGPATVAILQRAINALKNPPAPRERARGTCSPPERLEFNLSPSLIDAIGAAGSHIESVANKVDTTVLHFTKYGRDFTKQMKLSPDGFFQAQIQLAYYKMYGHLVSTYESGSLRKFRLGRTETIRSASIPVLKWCQAMVDKSTSPTERLRLLRESVQHHRWYTKQVVEGQAIDRHLLGLKLTAIDNSLEMPEFLGDPLFDMSCHWNLSTTTVPITDGVIFFGPVVEDGYGVYYNAQKSHVEFGLSAWNTCPTTDLYKFRDSLEGALIDTYETCMQQPKL